MVKGFLYAITTVLAVWALSSINFNNVFKKNSYYQSRLLYLFLSMSIAYLVTNFLYDFFLTSSFI